MTEPKSKIEWESPDPPGDAPPVICLSCGAELYTQFISANQSSEISIRCGGCGEFMGGGIKANAPVIKSAWWSLWLGLSSIILLFFTGVPAVYLGIRSLLRMRHTGARLGDRRAAIAGTFLGSVFGIIGGFCFLGIVGVVVLAIWTRETTDDLAQSKIVLSGIANADLPDQLNQGFAILSVNTHQFRFGDAQQADERTCTVAIVYFPPAMIGAAATLQSQLRSHRLRKDASYKFLDESPLAWNIAGKPTTVFKYVLEETVDDESGHPIKNKVHLYAGFASIKQGVFGISCSVRQPNDIFPDQASVQSFFESVTPVDRMHPAAAWKEAKSIGVTQKDGTSDETGD